MRKHTNFVWPVILVAVAALAFAGWRWWGAERGANGAWPELEGGVYAETVQSGGTAYLVPPNEIYDSGLGIDGHPRLLDPELETVLAADEKIADDLHGLAVTVNGEHRFYPFQIMNWHEVVHDTVGGKSLLITYSALTGSAVVYEPVVEGEERQFGDSGKIYNNATLLYDESSNTLWNQTTGQAIVGREAGQQLTVYPSVVMRWDEWKDAHPGGLSLSTNTGFARDYGRHPYGGYETAPGVFFPLNHTGQVVAVKEAVYRLEGAAEPVVFTKSILGAQTQPNETVGEGDAAIHAVALMDYDTFTTRIFNRVVNGQVLTFVREGKTKITDAETGSSWSLEGRALSGPLVGTQLELLPSSHHYAFAQFAMFPDTRISGYELVHPDINPTEPETDEEDQNNS